MVSFPAYCLLSGAASPPEVVLPERVVVAAKLMEISPAVEAGRMAIIEDDSDGVVADRIEPDDPDAFLAGHRDLLAGTVTLDLGARTFDSQKLGRQLEAGAVLEGDGDGAAAGLEADFLGPGGSGFSRHR